MTPRVPAWTMRCVVTALVENIENSGGEIGMKRKVTNLVLETWSWRCLRHSWGSHHGQLETWTWKWVQAGDVDLGLQDYEGSENIWDEFRHAEVKDPLGCGNASLSPPKWGGVRHGFRNSKHLCRLYFSRITQNMINGGVNLPRYWREDVKDEGKWTKHGIKTIHKNWALYLLGSKKAVGEVIQFIREKAELGK